MKPINKFILHVVNNMFPLNEYSSGTLSKIIKHYREEADDLNIDISDEKLKKYIERFDKIKSDLIRKGEITDLVNGRAEVIVPLSKLIKIVSATAGDEVEEETPDVVYQEGGVTIWNGSTEDNCMTFGRNERWCIAKGSFKNYRYDVNRKYPTFYLVRDTNLPDSDPKSFFVVVVGSDGTYKVSDRTNNDYGQGQTEWQTWKPWSFVEQEFPSVQGLRNVLKYIPLTSKEKVTQLYKDKEIDIREWIKLTFNEKTQYLVVRRGKNLFNDISNKDFVEKYLPKYPQVATFIAKNEGIIAKEILVQYLDKFSNQNTRSIIANMRTKLDQKALTWDQIPFEVKKFLVKFDKWDLAGNQRMYVTEDGSTIVVLTLDETGTREIPIKMGLFQQEDDYPNVKINKRTVKYLLEYPDLANLPFEMLEKLAQQDLIDREVVVTAFNNLEDTSDQMTIEVDGVKTRVYFRNMTTKTVTDEGNLEEQPVNEQVLADESIKLKLIQYATAYLQRDVNLPEYLNLEGLYNVLETTTEEQRTYQESGIPKIMLFSKSLSVCFSITKRPVSWEDFAVAKHIFTNKIVSSVRVIYEYTSFLAGPVKRYYEREGIQLGISIVTAILNAQPVTIQQKINFVEMRMPVSTDNNPYELALEAGMPVLVNTQVLGSSYKLASTNRLVQTRFTAAEASTILGRQIVEPQRTNQRAPQPGQQTTRWTQPAPTGDINIQSKMDEYGVGTEFRRIPNRDLRRLAITNGAEINKNTDGGARRRNQQLGASGTVIRAYAALTSRIYVIRLTNGSHVVSIKVYPGNREYVLIPGRGAYALSSPDELITSLRQNNLAEVRKYIINSYLNTNPTNIEEVKQLLRKHIKS